MHGVKVLGLFCIIVLLKNTVFAKRISCYDAQDRAQRCIPPFENAAYKRHVEATNTCGSRGPEDYTLQTGVTGDTKATKICDQHDPYNGFERSHNASRLTDFHRPGQAVTWWQSSTMKSGTVQYPNMVNLTLRLGKTFEVTYVRLKFYSSRPESFAIYKRTRPQGAWIPWQFYSASCRSTYKRRAGEVITKAQETKAVCTNEFSDISPLTGASVVFSTLEGRPSAYSYETSLLLQEWVSAVDIKITLNRLNTFGDEVFGDPNVLRSYFYAISDFAVGGRCKCNGHASECVESNGPGVAPRKGPDCSECMPSHNDRPWHRATSTDAHECLPCICNGLSKRCRFDQNLYDETGHGGHCLDCEQNTAGPHCEKCKENHFRPGETGRCDPCNCDPTGSKNLQCDKSGRCACKPGVTGEKCNRCEANYYDFTIAGCTPCQCVVAGSKDNSPSCRAEDGECACKENVEGQNCDSCKPGYYGLKLEDDFGCTACFCNLHSSICSVAPGFGRQPISSTFDAGKELWSGVDNAGAEVAIQYNALSNSIGLSASDALPLYFKAAGDYLGDQMYSYNKFLTFSFRVGEDGAQASAQDVVLKGSGLTVSVPIFAQSNSMPSTDTQEYRFRLHEHPSYQWSPSLSAMDFQKLLSNITEVLIRGTYTTDGVGYLDNVVMESAQRGGIGADAAQVEQCDCPDGYEGQICEQCSEGFRREPAFGGSLAKCVPCNCNGHSDTCDVESGVCDCQHNTTGTNCDKCAPGYYGYALQGTADDCKPCPCPNGGECVQLLNDDVVCINCKEGYTGTRCDLCVDGYFGDPTGRYGPKTACSKCNCNENIDPNGVGNCNTTSGDCLKCIYNTAGSDCGECLPGYWGDALLLPKGDCTACNCYEPGSEDPIAGSNAIQCDLSTGQCPCRPHVTGSLCDRCDDGFWKIESGNGCEACNCDPVGSVNATCNITTGQCFCQPGVTGRTCSQCEDLHYGFSDTGCLACQCDPLGSQSMQCDLQTGQCPCKPNIESRTCNMCVENMFNISAGCLACPVCYNLIQDRVKEVRGKVAELREIIENIGDNPKAINDTDFRQKMKEVDKKLDNLLDEARRASGGSVDGSLTEQLEKTRKAVQEMMKQCEDVQKQAEMARKDGKTAKLDIGIAENAIEHAQKEINAADAILDGGQAALEDAKREQEASGAKSEQLTEIAQEARELAKTHEDEAKRIEETAKEALNTSKEAWNIAQTAMRQPKETMKQIDKIESDLTDNAKLFKEATTLANEAHKTADDAYDAAQKASTDAEDVTLPRKIDTDEMNKMAESFKEDADRYGKHANELREQYKNLVDDVNAQKKDVEGALNEGIRQQQRADELLADADVARSLGQKAVDKAEETLKEANNTLKTLKEFDQKVQESKQKSQDALDKVPDIEKELDDAEKKIQTAADSLSGAESDATKAEDNANMAADTATEASADAKQIKSDADVTKQKTEQMKKDGEKLKQDTQAAENRVNQFEDQAIDDKEQASMALEKAAQARKAAEDSSDQVQNAMETVKDIISSLDLLDSIDSAQLDNLEKNLQDANETLKKADLEKQYNSIIESRNRQQKWIKDYTAELIKLRKDVENIAQINATIPRTCFRTIVLEPTESTGGR